MSTTSSPSHTLLVLISGGGTNLQALIDACNTPSLPDTRIARVVSNRQKAYGLERAQNANIPTTYHNLVKYKKQHPGDAEGVRAAREEYDLALAKLIAVEKPTLVVCAGWMHILSASFINALAHDNIPIINLHPALPGQFNGANAIGRAWQAFQRGEVAGTGVMVHYVISEVDMGEPIVVKEVAMKPDEPESELEARIHQVEWAVIVEGVGKALDRVTRAQNGGIEAGAT